MRGFSSLLLLLLCLLVLSPWIVLPLLELEGSGDVRNLASAAIAPCLVAAEGGMISGAGRGPVYGMRRRGLDMRCAAA